MKRNFLFFCSAFFFASCKVSPAPKTFLWSKDKATHLFSYGFNFLLRLTDFKIWFFICSNYTLSKRNVNLIKTPKPLRLSKCPIWRKGWDSSRSDSSRGAARSRALRIPPITTIYLRMPPKGTLRYTMRKGWDSNPRGAKRHGVPGRSVKPLRYPSS